MAKAGFPIYLYEPLPAQMRRLATPAQVMKLVSDAKKTQFRHVSRIEAKKQSYHRSEAALVNHFLQSDQSDDLFWEDIPLPSVGDPQEEIYCDQNPCLNTAQMLGNLWMSLTSMMDLTIKRSS